MKLLIILVVSILGVCSAFKLPWLHLALYSEHVAIPGIADGIVKHQVGFQSKNPDVKHVVDVFQHSHTSHPATIQTQMDCGKPNENVDIALESQPGQGINSYVTVVYSINPNVQNKNSEQQWHEQIVIPAAISGKTQSYTLHTRAPKNQVINSINVDYKGREYFLQFQILEGGIGFDEVKILIESKHNIETDVNFTFN